jgi:hypothetical protein
MAEHFPKTDSLESVEHLHAPGKFQLPPREPGHENSPADNENSTLVN